MRPDEIIFEVTEAPEGGHDTIAQGAAIFTARELASGPYHLILYYNRRYGERDRVERGRASRAH